MTPGKGGGKRSAKSRGRYDSGGKGNASTDRMLLGCPCKKESVGKDKKTLVYRSFVGENRSGGGREKKALEIRTGPACDRKSAPSLLSTGGTTFGAKKKEMGWVEKVGRKMVGK